MANSLGWSDDDNWFDFAHWLKMQFDLELPVDDLLAIMNAGDLYDAIMVRLPVSPNNRKCASAMAFYRLRQALSDLRAPSRIFPSTSLSCVEPHKMKEALQGLGAEERLHVPCARHGRLFSIIGNFVFFSVVAFLVLCGIHLGHPHDVPLSWLAISLGMAMSGFWVMQMFPDRVPEGCWTVGDLAKRIAAYNYGRFIRLGARQTEDEVWDAMCEALAEFALIPKSEITRDTVFYDGQIKKAA